MSDGEPPQHGVSPMSQQSALRQLQPLESRSTSRDAREVETTKKIGNWLRTTIRQPDVIVVLAMCAFGLILTFVAMAWMPDLSTTMADINWGP
jgi:hypothetical protein